MNIEEVSLFEKMMAGAREPVPASDQVDGYCRECEANQCIPAPVDMCPGCQSSKTTVQSMCVKCAKTKRMCSYCARPFLEPGAPVPAAAPPAKAEPQLQPPSV